jgi:uncharacterized protein (DUF2225 family)
MADLDKLLYDVNVNCPVCAEAFRAQRVRKSALIPDGRDTDFYVRYRDFDPTDYSIWQCPSCGYANADTSFDEVNPAERHVLREALKAVQPLAVPRERDLATVMALFERAVFAARARNSHSRAAGLYLRMAWVHRREGNAADERTYLEQAFSSYLEAYQSEPFPLGKMSELTVQYLLGELARRLGRYNEAVQYFAGVTQSRDHSEPQIVNMAKEQWELTRQEAAAAEAAGPQPDEEDVAAAAEVAATAAAAATVAAASIPTDATAAPNAAQAQAQPVLAGFSILPSQLEWLQQVARHSGDRLDRSTVLQAVLAVVQTLPPERVARPTAEELWQVVRQELAGGR